MQNTTLTATRPTSQKASLLLVRDFSTLRYAKTVFSSAKDFLLTTGSIAARSFKAKSGFTSHLDSIVGNDYRKLWKISGHSLFIS